MRDRLEFKACATIRLRESSPCLRMLAALVLYAIAHAASAERTCSEQDAVALLVMAQGAVTIGKQTAATGHVICAGAELTTGPESRAVVKFLTSNAVFHIDQGTTLQFRPPGAKASVGLLRGALNALFRKPGELDVETPIVNASIKGTEYLVRVIDGGTTVVSVFEGTVGVSGRTTVGTGYAPVTGTIDVGSGHRLIAQPGADLGASTLQVAVAKDELAWSLYYPPIVESAAHPELQRAAELLRVGRVDDAERLLMTQALASDPSALALKAVIAVVRNDKDAALGLANSALTAAPDSAAAHIALSYAYQARFQIENALATLVECAQRDSCESKGALFQARLTELYLANGELVRALRQCTGEPAGGLALACGFAELANGKSSRALALLIRAVADLPEHPLARLGLGLTRIRKDDIAAGRADIEIAAALDPLQSVIRSYLGKAYLEERRCISANPESGCSLFDAGSFDLAIQQYDLARDLDPADPTPDLYAAIAKQSENQPIEALRDLESSMAKNDNRAVYRSKLLLDRDLASRGTSLARIYEDLGFTQLGMNTASKSVAIDPGNYSAHRFLADIYQDLRRHEVAQASEILQYQLLQPINSSPIRPQLAEIDLKISNRIGPAELGFNEFNRAFLRDGLNFVGSETHGSHGSDSQEILVSGAFSRASFSLGHFGTATEGFRVNNDISHDIYDAFAQYALSDLVTLSLEYRTRDTDEGDRTISFDPSAFDTDLRNRVSGTSFRVGLRYQPRSSVTIIATYLNAGRRQFLSDTIEDTATLDVSSKLLTNDFQIASIIELGDYSSLIAGLGYSVITDASASQLHAPGFEFGSRGKSSDWQSNGFLYWGQRLWFGTSTTIGVSYEALESGGLSMHRVNPKIGISVPLANLAVIRAGYVTNIKRNIVAAQTLEPTQVAGFSQIFDDQNGFKTERIGVGFDSVEYWRSRIGIETSRRILTIPIHLESLITGKQSIREYLYRAYMYSSPNDRLAFAFSPELEDFQRPQDFLPTVSRHVRTWTLPLSFRNFFSLTTPKLKQKFQFTTDLSVSHVEQSISRPIFSTFGQTKESFDVIDFDLTYRFPRRRGAVNLGVRNLADSTFLFQDLNFQTAESVEPRFQPTRTVEVQVILNLDF